MTPEEMRDDIPADVREALAAALAYFEDGTTHDLARDVERAIRPNPRTVHLPAAELPAPLEEVPGDGRCWSWYWSHGMEGVTDYTPTREQFAEGIYFATREDAEAWLAHLQSWKRPGADWTPHTPGDPMPCDGEALLNVRFRDGDTETDAADAWEWGHIGYDHGVEITAWRYAREDEA